MGLFGLSFGASKTNTNNTDTLNKTENTNQNQSTNTNQSQSGTQNTSQTQNSTSAGASSQTSTQAGTTSQQSNQSTAQTSSNYSSDVLNALTKTLLGTAASGGGAASSSLTDLIGKLGSFDPQEFVKGITDSARTQINQSADAAVGSSDSSIGGTAGTNSMAALLDQTLRGNAASQIAGVQSQAEATAQGIVGQNASTVQNAVNSQQGFLAQLADALKGGVSTTTGQAAGSTTGASATTGTQNTSTAESTSQTGSTNTVTHEDLTSLINAILAGTTQTNATDVQKGSTLKFGGGASVG